MRNSATILNLNADPTTFQLYLVGSSSIATQVAFDGIDFASDLVMAVYAPYSTIRIKGDSHLSGAIASKSIDLQNSAQITYHQRIEDITTGSPLRLYRARAVPRMHSAPDRHTAGLGLLTAMNADRTPVQSAWRARHRLTACGRGRSQGR